MQKNHSDGLSAETVNAMLESRPNLVALLDENRSPVWEKEDSPFWKALSFFEKYQPDVVRAPDLSENMQLTLGDGVLRLVRLEKPWEMYYGLEHQRVTRKEPLPELLSVFERNYRAELSDIFGALGLLRPLIKGNANGASYLEVIDRSALMLFRSARVFSQYLRLSNDAWETMAWRFDLCGMAAGFVSRIEKNIQEGGGSITLLLPQEPVMICADETMAELILGHLVSNGLGRGRADCEIVVGVEQQEDTAVLFVSDNGTGIDAEIQQDLFCPHPDAALEHYFRASNGLGFPIVKMAAEQCGGEIGVLSSPERGTMVQVRFPIAEGAEDANRLRQQYPENPSRFDNCHLLTLDGLERQKEEQKKAGVL